MISEQAITPIPKDKLANATRCLKALANPTRLAILCALKDGEQPVQAIEAAVGASQSAVSMQLATMRDRDILLARRQGSQVFYRIADPRLLELLAILKAMHCPDWNE
ncbi:MAG: ArsR/SmtB family transcription factor [Candidatus Melainabacteria bacterium]